MTQFLSRTALVLVTASALTTSMAWAQMPKPNFPIALPKGTEDQPTVTAEPDSAVRETPPMPATPEPEGVEARALAEAAAPRATPRPAPAATRTETRTSVAGRVVDADGPAKVHVVKKGDTLAAIGREWDMDPEDIAKQNGIKPPYRLHPGDTVKGPKGKAKAYVVGQGDTLYAVARRFSVTAKALAEANDMSAGQALKSGRKLILPAGYKDKGPTRTQVVVASGEAEVETSRPAPSPAARPATRPAAVVKPTPDVVDEPAAEPARPTVTTRVSVTGKVVEFTGKPVSYTVRKGDAVDSIAHSMGMTRKEFADLNNLEAPYALRPGKVLKGPPRTLKAYVPVEGDTLALIAKRFSTTPKALAALNGKTVRPGKRLTLPDGVRDRGPVRETIRSGPAPTPTPRPAPVTPPPAERPSPPVITPRPYVPPPVAPRPQTPTVIPPTVSSPLSDAQISALGRGRFVWPLRGEMISDFGPKGTGQRNDGINIRAHTGDTVRAAAAGDVVYAGDQVPGFGNLILVKHADGWVTAYGHLARVDVKMQQKVVQGQQLGLAGDTGGMSEVQLHFEVRYAPVPTERARPVNPELVLGK